MRKRVVFIIIIMAIIFSITQPVKACRNGKAPLISISIRLPGTVTIYNPIKGFCKGHKIEKAVIKNGRIIFKNGKKYKLKPQYKDVLMNGSKVIVYRKNHE